SIALGRMADALAAIPQAPAAPTPLQVLRNWGIPLTKLTAISCVAAPPLSGSHMLDERRVRYGVDRDRLLHEAGGHLPALAGRPPVKPECELVQVIVQVRPRYRPLMRPE